MKKTIWLDDSVDNIQIIKNLFYILLKKILQRNNCRDLQRLYLSTNSLIKETIFFVVSKRIYYELERLSQQKEIAMENDDQELVDKKYNLVRIVA